MLKLSRMVCICMNIELCRNPVLQVCNSVVPPQSVDVGVSPKSRVQEDTKLTIRAAAASQFGMQSFVGKTLNRREPSMCTLLGCW